MNKNSLITGLVALSLCSGAFALDSPPPFGETQGFEIRDSSTHKVKKHGKKHEFREKLKQMSEEERAAFKAEVKEKWEALSDEEKAQFKAKMEARKQAQEERRLVRQYGMHLLMQQENSGE